MKDLFPLPDNALPAGFQFAAVQAGIKASGRADLAAVYAPNGASAAAMFTSNRMTAAPLHVDKLHLEKTAGHLRAVLVNSGNANCATGEIGIEAAKQSCIAAAQVFNCKPEEVFPSSTGIIGVPLPVEKIISALPALHAALGASPQHMEQFARGIMTTDTRPKAAYASFTANGKTVRIAGFAKGAGMIHPQVVPHATMLVYLFTDILIEPQALASHLHTAVDSSFNCISIDGDTSTNDTVLLSASGASGVAYNASLAEDFSRTLSEVCSSLAHQIVDDGEGVTHVVTLEISGAKTAEDARKVAKAIAHSPLCKTAWSSADPNWGRIIAAAGYSGVAIEPALTSISIGPHKVFDHGTRGDFDESATHQTMLAREFTIAIDLGLGNATCRFVTCDLTVEYVHINADYST